MLSLRTTSGIFVAGAQSHTKIGWLRGEPMDEDLVVRLITKVMLIVGMQISILLRC